MHGISAGLISLLNLKATSTSMHVMILKNIACKLTDSTSIFSYFAGKVHCIFSYFAVRNSRTSTKFASASAHFRGKEMLRVFCSESFAARKFFQSSDLTGLIAAFLQ